MRLASIDWSSDGTSLLLGLLIVALIIMVVGGGRQTRRRPKKQKNKGRTQANREDDRDLIL